MHYITWSFGPDAKFIDISNSIYNKIRARMPSGSLWLGFRKSKQRWTHFQIRVPSPVQMFLTALNKSLCNPIPPSIPLEEFFHFPEAMRRGLAGVTWNMCEALWIGMHYVLLNYSIWERPAPDNSAENLLAAPVHSTSSNSGLLFYLCAIVSSSCAKFMDLN